MQCKPETKITQMEKFNKSWRLRALSFKHLQFKYHSECSWRVFAVSRCLPYKRQATMVQYCISLCNISPSNTKQPPSRTPSTVDALDCIYTSFPTGRERQSFKKKKNQTLLLKPSPNVFLSLHKSDEGDRPQVEVENTTYFRIKE